MHNDFDFTIEREGRYIRLIPDKRDLWGTNRRNNSDDSLNAIELSYRQEDEDGFGIGGDEYITTQDIAAMSQGIQQIINKETTQFFYSCFDEIIKINIEISIDNLISFTFSMLETLNRDYYISITLSNMTINEFKDKTRPFVEWERMFPTLKSSWLSLYHETYDAVFEYDCINGSKCEADFNTKVFDVLENTPYEFANFLDETLRLLKNGRETLPEKLSYVIKNF
ncbi:MAG: hypothetical protein ACOX6U_08180 [Oscillospiraceae bacterium]|jgi:hypothetical protein